jgi:hypothetical protein
MKTLWAVPVFVFGLAACAAQPGSNSELDQEEGAIGERPCPEGSVKTIGCLVGKRRVAYHCRNPDTGDIVRGDGSYPCTGVTRCETLERATAPSTGKVFSVRAECRAHDSQALGTDEEGLEEEIGEEDFSSADPASEP